MRSLRCEAEAFECVEKHRLSRAVRADGHGQSLSPSEVVPHRTAGPVRGQCAARRMPVVVRRAACVETIVYDQTADENGISTLFLGFHSASIASKRNAYTAETQVLTGGGAYIARRKG